MNFITSCTRFIRVSIISAIVPITLFAQEGLEASTQKTDSATIEDTDSKHALYTGIGYGNDLLCMGSSISQGKPYYLGSLTYGFNNEFFASASTYHLAAFNTFLAFHTFSLNYSHVFNPWFDISISASRYQV